MLYKNVMAGESIEYDADRPWVKEVISAFTKYRTTQSAQLAVELGKVISTGINGNVRVNIVDEPSVTAAILPPDISIKHPLVNDFRETAVSGKDGMALLYKLDKKIGGVNLEKGTLYGTASELPMIIILTTGFLSFGINSRQKAAILTHEVGHGIGYILGLTQLVRSSAIIANAQSVILNEKARDKRITFIKVATEMQGKTCNNEEAIALAEVDDSRVLGGMFATNSSEGFRSKYGSDLYDNQLFETIADNFSARCGLGPELGEALVKLHKSHFSFETMNTPGFLIIELLKTLVLLISFSSPITLVSLLISGWQHHLAGSEYPTLRGRIEKLLQDTNLQLRDSKIHKDKRRRLISAYDSLEVTLESVKRETGLVHAVNTWIHSSAKDRSRRDTIRSLETLSANSLHTAKHRIQERLEAVKR